MGPSEVSVHPAWEKKGERGPCIVTDMESLVLKKDGGKSPLQEVEIHSLGERRNTRKGGCVLPKMT